MAQMLTAAYACPQLAPTEQGDAGVNADCMGAMANMDPDQPLLCKAHCEAGGQSVNSQAGVLDAPPAAAAVCTALAGVLRVAETGRLAATMPASLAQGPPAGGPPLYLSLLVLRN